jgi:hypothetical protein
MYKLRDDMSAQCKRLGAMFDERSFDCVYTVNFFAGDDQTTPKASRKAYAGNTFVCMQEWFGINVTTYKENAFRETRAQTAASSAMLGSGVGTAVGLVTSGAIGRALKTQKAKKEMDAAAASAGDGDASSPNDTFDPETMSDEDKRKHEDYQNALENNNTYGTDNAEDYATVKNALESDAMKPTEHEFPTGDSSDDDLMPTPVEMPEGLEDEED